MLKHISEDEFASWKGLYSQIEQIENANNGSNCLYDIPVSYILQKKEKFQNKSNNEDDDI